MKDITVQHLTFLVLFMFMGTATSWSQSQDWYAESTLVTINGNAVELNSVLTKQGGTFTWQQNGYNTQKSETFAIEASTGNWDSQNQLGELVYTLSIDSNPATLRITGTSDEDIVMELTIHADGNATADSYTFLIETTTNL